MRKSLRVVSDVTTIHPKYGRIVKGEALMIEPQDFNKDLFSRARKAKPTALDNYGSTSTGGTPDMERKEVASDGV